MRDSRPEEIHFCSWKGSDAPKLRRTSTSPRNSQFPWYTFFILPRDWNEISWRLRTCISICFGMYPASLLLSLDSYSINYYLLKVVTFNSYVSLPEGKWEDFPDNLSVDELSFSSVFFFNGHKCGAIPHSQRDPQKHSVGYVYIYICIQSHTYYIYIYIYIYLRSNIQYLKSISIPIYIYLYLYICIHIFISISISISIHIFISISISISIHFIICPMISPLLMGTLSPFVGKLPHLYPHDFWVVVCQKHTAAQSSSRLSCLQIGLSSKMTTARCRGGGCGHIGWLLCSCWGIENGSLGIWDYPTIQTCSFWSRNPKKSLL